MPKTIKKMETDTEDSSSLSDDSSSNNDNLKKNDVSSKLQKKRGRPRKNVASTKVSNVLKQVSQNKDDDRDEEIILHLPLYDDDEKNLNDTSSDKNMFTMKDESDKKKSNKQLKSLSNFSDLSDSSSEPESDESEKFTTKTSIKKLLTEIKKRDTIIKKLKTNIADLKNDNNDSYYLTAGKNIKTSMLDLKLININNDNKLITVEKTEIACWWCSYNFDTMPCFIPDRYVNEKFYVFGCFCTYSCALAYNINMNDYRVPLRISLIKKLYSKIYSVTDQDANIQVAPQKELLQKFGGNMTILEFRNDAILRKKDFKVSIPPLIPLIPMVEEIQKDCTGNKVFTVSNNKTKK